MLNDADRPKISVFQQTSSNQESENRFLELCQAATSHIHGHPDLLVEALKDGGLVAKDLKELPTSAGDLSPWPWGWCRMGLVGGTGVHPTPAPWLCRIDH